MITDKMSIQRRSLAEEVADLIKHKIKSGAFAIDAKLPTEPELMQQFGVGRSTVREAIKYLANSGFVTVQQGLGTFVKSLDGNNQLDEKIENGDFAEVFEVRQTLELKIIENATHYRTAKHLKEMQKHLKDRKIFAESGQLQACINADIAFHTTIADGCGNSILSTLYRTLSLHVAKFFASEYKNTNPFLVSQDLHEALWESISQKDTAKAIKLANKIIGNQ